MHKTCGFLFLSGVIAWTQIADPGHLVYLHTFGSKQGIHPQTVLNRRMSKGALGKGENPYGLLFPVAVTTDLRGRVWITDGGTRSVHVFDNDGRGYREIRRVDGLTIDQPSGIASDEQGRIYVTDSGRSCDGNETYPVGEPPCQPHKGGVLAFDEKGEFDRWVVKRSGSPLERPTTMALSEDGRTIYVADPPRNVIVAFNREGEVNATIPLPADLQDPGNISVVHNQIHVLGNLRHRVGVFAPSGARRNDVEWDGIQLPAAFTYDPVRRWFLVVNPRWMIVQIFDEKGRNIGAFGQEGDGVDQMLRVDSLHVDREGLIYVVDSHHGKVLVFSAR